MSALRLGVIVPCRNEARVIARKLANLAGLRWLAGKHQVVVVDDGSGDDTLALARAARCPVELRVITNHGAPGKSGAVRAACAALASSVDLIVLTDADVVLEADALVVLARAFEEDLRLTLACGAQQFVRDFETRVPVDHPFDCLTAQVRAVESRLGKLFSVHGQLLAWRTSAQLLPTAGRPADDLDLMFAARRAGGRVRLIAGARFLEEKVESHVDRHVDSEGQALRRARAYFEALRGRHRPLGEGLVDRVQWAFYRYVPALTPELLAPLRPLLCLTQRGRRALRLLDLIRRARREESVAPLSDRWEMQRS